MTSVASQPASPSQLIAEKATAKAVATQKKVCNRMIGLASRVIIQLLLVYKSAVIGNRPQV
jgi:hypothetical protein